MNYKEIKGSEGIMSAVDLKKAFDPLSLDILFKSLELFGTVFHCILKIYTDKIQSKLLYETLSSQISSEPTAMKKI